MRYHPLRSARLAVPSIALLALIAASGVAPARADGRPMLPADMPRAYTQECASCHTAYPPGMLPARSWQRLMGGLDAHYGSDASLDPATVAELSRWLQVHAGSYKRTGAEPPPQDRITRSAWFERKHRQLDAAAWTHASVRSAANCAACHPGADRGRYDDDELRLPPGIGARQRRFWFD